MNDAHKMNYFKLYQPTHIKIHIQNTQLCDKYILIHRHIYTPLQANRNTYFHKNINTNKNEHNTDTYYI